jgi:hypothetical protein
MSAGEKTPKLTRYDVADYVAEMAGELSEMCEGARLDTLATLLYAARLEARRAAEIMAGPRTRRADVA